MSDPHLTHCYLGDHEDTCKYGEDATCSGRFLLPFLAHDILTETAFFDHENCPFAGTLFEGDRRVLVVTGENAAGKSLFFRFIASRLHSMKIVPVSISIRERTGGGSMEMGRMRQMFMFGDEQTSSTGAASARVVKTGFHNAGRESPGVLMLDEPEMGLSDGYARALGELIGQTARTPEADGGLLDLCRGVVVVTHNRALAAGLCEGLRATPAFVNMSRTPVDMSEWLKVPEYRSLADLERLQDIASERRKATQAILNEITER